MRFPAGQSGNPAGRPPGSRNKKTELAEDVLAVAAQETAIQIVARAQCGDKAAMRLVMERTVPTGTDRPLELALPTVESAEDLIAAAGVVLKALAAGDISSRETVCLLTVVDRLGRIADRAQQMKERRAGRRDGPPAAAVRTTGAGLYSPVNSQTAAQAEPLYSPVNSANEVPENPGSATAAPSEAQGEGLYSPVNSTHAAAGAQASASPAQDQKAAQGLYSPVNAAAKAAARPQTAPAPEGLKRRRRALMESVSPAALLLGGGLPVDPRSYVTDQTWLASLKETGLPGATKRNAA
jgi:hypothetical protein